MYGILSPYEPDKSVGIAFAILVVFGIPSTDFGITEGCDTGTLPCMDVGIVPIRFGVDPPNPEAGKTFKNGF